MRLALVQNKHGKQHGNLEACAPLLHGKIQDVLNATLHGDVSKTQNALIGVRKAYLCMESDLLKIKQERQGRVTYGIRVKSRQETG